MKVLRATLAVLIVAVALAGVVATSPKAYAAQAMVDLQTASPFAILAGTPVISDAGGASVITGDVGMHPATGAGIGLLCSQVTGTIYSVDAAGPLPCRVTDNPLLVLAKTHLTAAFTDAAGRTPLTTVPTELGGTTRTDGVYDSGSTQFQITAGAGPLVIDGQGDPSSVFIFNMGFSGTGLTVGPGSSVSLINGASACNIFWVVDTASIDTTAVFKGNVLALNSISVNNGANIEGRLLARNGQVTLNTDTVDIGTCLGASTTTSTGTSPPPAASVPRLPNTGFAAEDMGGLPWNIFIPIGITVAPLSIYLARKKRAHWSKH